MNIINMSKLVQFSEIKQGECFLYDNCLFMKIEPHIMYVGEYDHKVMIVAVNIVSGSVTSFDETDKVIQVNATVSLG